MISAWHFVGDALRDGRPIPPDGEWLVHEGKIEMCRRGLHASERLIDALKYAPGNTVCRVLVRGVGKKDGDKCVARERLILWRYDAEKTLRAFALKAALSVAHLWNMPDAVRRYLETGDDDIRDVASAIASDAASAVAWAAASDAAKAAAAWAAASAVAWAASAAASDAALTKFDEQLTAMIREADGNPDDQKLIGAVS